MAERSGGGVVIAAAWVLAIAAAVIWLAPAVVVLVVAVRDHLADIADARRRAEQDREVTDEWLAVLAATEPTPIYDALVCEHIEKAEGWA